MTSRCGSLLQWAAHAAGRLPRRVRSMVAWVSPGGRWRVHRGRLTEPLRYVPHALSEGDETPDARSETPPQHRVLRSLKLRPTSRRSDGRTVEGMGAGHRDD